MNDRGFGDVVPPRDTKDETEASEVKNVETVFLEAACSPRLAVVLQDIQDVRGVELYFDIEVVTVPDTRNESPEVVRSLSNFFVNFVIQTFGRVDNRSQKREFIDNFKAKYWINCRRRTKTFVNQTATIAAFTNFSVKLYFYGLFCALSPNAQQREQSEVEANAVVRNSQKIMV